MTLCIEQAQEGDSVATRSLIETLRPRLVKMAVYYGRRTGEDPDDLLQEAWLGLLEALPQLDLRIGSPEQHLIQRARWRLLDSIKRARVRRCLPLEEIAWETQDGSVSERVASDVCASQFSRRLKDSQRDILHCLLRGLTWRETGDALGCTSANVAYHVRQIRSQYEEWRNRD